MDAKYSAMLVLTHLVGLNRSNFRVANDHSCITEEFQLTPRGFRANTQN